MISQKVSIPELNTESWTHNIKQFRLLPVNLRGVDVGEGEVGDHNPGWDLEGEIGGDDGVVVEASAVHDVGQPH